MAQEKNLTQLGRETIDQDPVVTVKRNQKFKLALIYHSSQQEICPHLGLLSLASYVKQYFPETIIKIVEESDPVKILGSIMRWRPQIVGFTADSLAYDRTKILSKEIKKKISVKTLLGGVHITASPNSFDTTFDIGIIGEGEETLRELVDLYKHKKDFKTQDLKKIDGIIYYYKGKIRLTKARKFVSNIDSLPFPALEMVPMEERYLTKQVNLYGVKRNINITTTRGCPYKCIYCGSPVHWGSARFHSVDYVIREIEHLIKEYHIDGITFSDDLFIAPKQRLFDLVKEIKARGWEKTIVFSGCARANLFDEEIAKALKSINVRKLAFGFESFTPKILTYLKNNSVTVEQNIKAIKLCHKYKIAVSSGFIVGSPGETTKDLKMTYQLMKKYPIENPHIYLLVPYPGTKIWDYAEKEKIVNMQMRSERLHTLVPLSAYFKFWERDRFFFLKDNVFLNTKMRHNKEYLQMILKMNMLANQQAYKYYFTQMAKDPRLLFRVVNPILQ